jgi:uncharacterized membrane protein YqjE
MAELSAAIRRLMISGLALGRIRLELLSIEVQEEKERVAALLFWAVLTALLAGFGLVFLALFATLLLWDSHRLVAVALGAVLFVGLGLVGAMRLRRLAGSGSTLFQASIAELREDGAALRRERPRS